MFRPCFLRKKDEPAISTVSGGRFPPLDKLKVMRELHVEEKAREDGVDNEPAPDADKPTPLELEIRSAAMGVQKLHADTCQRYTSAHEKEYADASDDLNLERIKNKDNARFDTAKQEQRRMAAELKRKADRLVAAARELLIYRSKHGLMDRTPHLRDGYWMLSLILGVFVLEVAVTFFLTREAGSTLTVFTVVLLYCMLNIGLPLLAGTTFVKYMFYEPLDTRHQYKIAFGVVVLLLVILFLAALNLGMGHYRSAGLTFEIEAADTVGGVLENFSRQQGLILAAYERFVDNPFGLGEILSWLLVILGFFLAIVALYEGVNWNDKYPRYGNLAKNYDKAHDDYEDTVQDHVENFNEIRREVASGVQATRDRFKRALTLIPELAARADNLHQEYEAASHTLEEDYQELISRYETLNAKYRTSPVPAYFGAPPQLDILPVEKFAPERIDQTVNEQEVYDHIDGVLQAVHSEFDQWIEAIPSAESVRDSIGDPMRIVR